MKLTFFTSLTEQTEALGERLARALDAENIKSAVIAMRGEMGVGKTAFVRGFARALGISGVKSPTYTVVNEYRGKRRVFHYDMYRIESEDDLVSTGYDDYLAADGYLIAEWSENVTEYLPEDAIFVTVSRTDTDSGRRIEFENTGGLKI